jgi:hypothetical protein
LVVLEIAESKQTGRGQIVANKFSNGSCSLNEAQASNRYDWHCTKHQIFAKTLSLQNPCFSSLVIYHNVIFITKTRPRDPENFAAPIKPFAC